ncbi:MAG TPA: hypothetical protein VEH49_09795 [Methylomirabilota bacterium]|nr:hypothetical protein [Methylomirabilota bacterium]
MDFTAKKLQVKAAVGAILAIAVMGFIVWGTHVASPPIIAKQKTFAAAESPQWKTPFPIIPAVEAVCAPGFQTARSNLLQPVTHWYKNKNWWKRNAPIVGGAGGGALVGGLLGGGKGAIIGGAVGGGGGYLYKRHKRHEEHYHHHHN